MQHEQRRGDEAVSASTEAGLSRCAGSGDLGQGVLGKRGLEPLAEALNATLRRKVSLDFILQAEGRDPSINFHTFARCRVV